MCICICTFLLKRPYGSRQLSADEIADAENVWYRMIQRDTLPQEYERLEQWKALQRSSRILKLDPYFDKKSRTVRELNRIPTYRTQPNIQLLSHMDILLQRT